jgi:Flp pilus assembly protein protease CpaA
MLATTLEDVSLSLASSLSVAVVALAIALARTREKVIRLEEWIRRYEKEETDLESQH